ncbi:non-ribosomal peptide synthetase [Streptomyces sp. WMMC897]|uniref:non-ribosomal peptide synthetase n=1 Tax=Streptomyces sp. WMMC897 TaxID=3014782 RepID=UPI0022B71D43|nr:non-ribosomal peptide synthetase [Streptomyces sp. WMMC897]MCZ7413615.1 amino acid adenylation domain-containing protein [Streptomyces sp. WMMC897]
MDGNRTTAGHGTTGPAAAPTTRRRLRARPAERGPLSFGQRRLWFLDRWLGENAVYNVPLTLRFTGRLDAGRLVRAVTSVAARHEALYTVFEEDADGEPQQHLLDVREPHCPLVELSGLDPAAARERATTAVEADARLPFDLAKDPMLRMTLYRLAEDEHWLHLTFHHIACDGWSLNLFQRQLDEAYRADGPGGEPPPVQYADYALWQSEMLDDPRVEAALARWTEALEGAPAVLDLGIDRPRPAEQTYRGRTVDFPLDGVSLTALEDFAAGENVSLYTVLLAAFQTLAARHSGAGDVVVGSPVAGRDNARLHELVGFFVDTLVLRVDVADDPSFRELVARSRTSLLDAMGRGRAPFDLAVSHLHPERSLSHNPVVQTLFAFHEEEHDTAFGAPGDGLTVERHMVPTDTAKFDLTWTLYRRSGSLLLQVEYATDLFDADTVQILVDHWRVLLGQVTAAPDEPVSRLELATPAERGLVREWAGDGRDLPVATIHELVLRRAVETPEAVAVVCGEETLTYAELVGRAARVAEVLTARGVGPETCVGVCVERSLETVTTTLGVMLAGGVYVPLDTAFPTDRMGHMLTEAHAPVLLVHGPTRDMVPEGPWAVVDVSEPDFAEPLGLDAVPPPGDVGPEHACYVIFTSGSTGRPKGTTVTHANVTRLFAAVRERLAFGPEDAWSLFHSFAFDVSVMEMWGALTTGGRLVVVPYLVSRDTDAFYTLVRDTGVTMLSQTPSAFRQFEAVDAERGDALRLRAVLFAGEALDRPSVRRWGSRRGYAEPLLVNLYGITETTVHVTYTEVTEEHLDGVFSLIGRALPDLRLHVLDAHGEPAPVGVTGELYVGGPGVTRCYTGRPELTAQRFVPDHLGDRPGARLYRSGDLARWRADGRLEYLGRADSQVKIRGFRIELGEVEAQLSRQPGIRQAVAVVRDDLGGQADLVAYLVPDTSPPSAGELREALSAGLPPYMVPRNFVFLDALPLTPQGKLDRRALPAPTGERPDLGAGFEPPLPGREEVLARIWGQVLGVDRVGRHDNFFHLGGDSIRSIQVLGQARNQGIGFQLQDLFRTPTLAGLAEVAQITDGEGASQNREPFSMISAADRDRLPDGVVDAYPMAELQVGMVYEMELDPERRPYHNVDSMRISGRFDEDAFRRALEMVVARHAILRTSLELSGYSEPIQLVHRAAEMPCRVADVRDLDSAGQEAAIAAYVAAERANGFDHSRPPLLRFGIHRLSEDAFQWTVTEHHAIFDGWSLHSTLAEITGLYQQLVAGEEPEALAPPESAYRDFIAAERAVLRSAESEGFWLDRVADRPDSQLPHWSTEVDERLSVPEREDEWRVVHEAEMHGAIETLLPARLCDALLDLALRCGVPLKSVLLAAHLRVMSLVTGDVDVIAGLSSNGRLEETGATEVRGLFLNTLPFRLRLPEGSWEELVRAVFDAEQEMLPHRRYPLGALQRTLGGEPLFETSFVYNHFHVLTDEFGSGRLEIVDGKIDSFSTLRAEPTNFPLSVGVIRNPYSTRLLLSLDYHLGVLVEDQVALLRDYYVRALEAMVADPTAHYGHDNLLSPTERRLVHHWSGDGQDLPVTTLHELVLQRARQTPHATAVTHENASLTYAELVGRAARIAQTLTRHGVGPETCVGVCVERSLDTVTTTLGIMLAGGAYVPLDTAFPTDRMHHMLTETHTPLLLVHAPTRDTAPEGPWDVIDISEPEFAQPLGLDTITPPHSVSPENACYVIFTSGSTGHPKGTTVTHANVTRLLTAVQQRFPFGPEDVWTLFHSYAFDFSVWEIWGALTTGAHLIVVPHHTTRDTHAFHTLTHHHNVTILSQTPTAFRQYEATDAQHGGHHHLRAIIFGGEALDLPSTRRWTQRHGHTHPTLINMYGITETTVHVTSTEVTEGHLDGAFSLIGDPLPDLRLHVLDAHGQPTPVGVTGELHVGGPGVTRGYTGRPALTAECFVPDHLGEQPGARLYRTGDLARRRADGRLEYLGRADSQVKIRGFRIELGEVEARLSQLPGIRQAVALARGDHGGAVELVAYLVPEADAPDATELRESLAGVLPPYMIPHHFVTLDALPLTPQGKLDRRALPAPTGERPDLGAGFEPPLPGREEVLAHIWAQVLGVERVGRHDDFFHLGGDSIRSIQILGHARDAGIGFHLQDLFQHSTLAELATVARADAAAEAEDGTVPEPFALLSAKDRDRLPDGVVDAYPMAELQVGMVYEMQRDPDRNPYVNITSLRVPGRFDEAAFRAALARVAERHAVLRTSFDLSGLSEPMQLVHAVAEPRLDVVDVRSVDEAARRAALAGHVERERATAFDPAAAPLWRMAVHLLADDAFQWTVTDHHAILDGWSLAATLTEVTEVYRALLDGDDAVPRPLRSAYRDFVAAERAALASADSAAFWRSLLADHPEGRLPRWPADRPHLPTGERVADERSEHDGDSGYGALVTVLPQELLDALEESAARIGVPFKSVVLAAHLRTLSLVTGTPDVVTGLSSNGRLEETDGTEVRGLFLNTLPFRLRLPEGTWADLARDVFRCEQAVLPHRRYPMAAIQRESGGAPLFETGFVYNHFRQVDAMTESGAAALSGPHAEGSTGVARTSFPVHVAVSREPGQEGMRLELEYDARSFAAEQMRLLRDYHLRALRAIAEDPEAAHHHGELLGETERALLAAWNDTAAPTPTTTVHALVEERAARTPGRIAVVAGERSLTYAELAAGAERMAGRLRRLGVGPERFVGVCLDRSPELVVALLAVLKAGGAYVPLDPAFPASRAADMLGQARADVVLASAETAERVPDGPWRTVDVEVLAAEGDEDHGAEAPALPGAGPDHACYVIFTSGSTGRPKGVVTRHRNVAELLHGGSTMELSQDDTLLQIATVAFDVSTYEIWAPLAAGARLVLAPAGPYTPEDVAGWVTEHGVTVLHATASLFALLVDQEPAALGGLRRLLTGSETVSPEHTARALALHPGLEVVNCWGPTETTTFSVCGSFTARNLPDGPLPLGTPLANTEVWVLDEAGRPVPVGSPGELCVAGPCLARGYLGNPELTAERFTPHPHRPGVRLYRTGDRGRWSADGRVEFLGRVDHMVKIRGYRVEPGEVGAALGAQPQVRQCVVTAVTDAAGVADLVAYVVCETPAPSAGELRAALRERLPDYMVPRMFLFLDELPLTPQGKIDRRRLPAPTGERPELSAEYAAPLPGAETLLADIWSQVLGVGRIGRDDDFFELGGDSIRSIQAVGRAREAGLRFGLPELFRAPTPARLARLARVAVTDGERPAALPATEPFSLLSAEDRDRLPHGTDDAYPMAELQLGMVYEMERDPERNPYHNVTTLRHEEPFREAAFREALALATARHAVLRTSFDPSGYSEPLQLVHTRVEQPLTVVDLRASGAEERRAAVEHFVRAEQAAPFAPGQAPLWRMTVHVLADDAFQWTVTNHHAILDGWSLAATLTEIAGHYRALLAGQTPEPAPVRSSFRGFVAAERAALASADSSAFWRDLLAERPDGRTPVLPVDHLPATGDDTSAGSLSTALPRELGERLEALARHGGVPLKSVLLAAHLRMLSVATGDVDVVTGLSSNGRLEETDGTEVRGLFLNTLPFRLRLPEGSWEELVRAVFDAEQEMLPHRRYPLGALQRTLGGEPLFETGFVYHHFRQLDDLATGVDGSAESEPIAGAGRTHFPLLVAVSRESWHDGLLLELEYDDRLLSSGQVALLRDSYVRALEAMVADPTAHYGHDNLLSPTERRLVHHWSGDGQDLPVTTLHELVLQRARQTPHATAVTHENASLTYAELVGRAARIAQTLTRHGVGPETCVGVCVERSLDTVTTTLGIMLAGGAYVPLDTAFPTDRMHHMLTETHTPLLLVHAPTRDTAPEGPWDVIDISEPEFAQPLGLDTITPPHSVSPENACYVIFTSGSTGHPKGTTVTHANVTRLLTAVQQRFPFGPEDVWTLFHSYAFDFSVWEIWGALTTGAHLIVVPHHTTRDTHAFHTLTHHHNVTILSQTPTAFRQYEATDAQHGGHHHLRAIIFGGEALDLPSTRRWTQRHGHTHPTLINMYGITETTVHVTTQNIDPRQLGAEHSNVGRPLPDLSTHVLDAHGQPTPVGVTGELHVGGPGVTRGYTGRPALTAERFVPDHLGEQPGARLYRTGDLARWRSDGTLEYLGRADSQVKIRGHRIETAEIDAQLSRQPGVRQAVVTARDDHDDTTALVAYLVPDGAPPTTAELREALGRALPPYMIPHHFVTLDALPLTPQGKLDRRALPAPTGERPDLGAGFEPPLPGREEVLAHIWAKVLGVERVGRHDDFFHLGGDSIRSIQILGHARDAGLRFGLPELFAAPTVAGLAEVAEEDEPPADTGWPPPREPFAMVSAADRDRLPDGVVDAYPMAELQVGMVYEMQRDPDRNPYHNVESLPMSGRFDEGTFRRAVRLVARRHPALRTSLSLTGYGEPLQLVHAEAEVPLTVVDVRGEGADAQRAALEATVRREHATPFVLETAPLMRMTVHVLSGASFQWTVTEHHAMLDGWSVASTLAEIAETYRALLDGEDVALRPLRSAYRDFVAAERAALASADSAAFWRSLLADRPEGRLPRRAADDGEPDGDGVLYASVPARLVDALEEFAAHAGVPFKSVVLAAHLRVVGLVTGRSDVVTGLTSNGRLEETDGTEVRGLFLNTLPFRLRLPEGTWADLARDVFRAERDLLPHRRYPMAALRRELGGGPLVDVSFTYNNFAQYGGLARSGALDTEGPGSGVQGVALTDFPCSVTFSREPVFGGMRMELEYDGREISAAQAERLRDYHLRALAAMARDAGAGLRETSLLSGAERARLAAWREEGADGGAGEERATVPELLRRQVARTPEAVAVEHGAGRLTFAELDARTDALAHRLRAEGVRRGDLVGVLLRPGVPVVISLWAVWKAGAAFVPLDPDLPERRLRQLLDDAGPVLVVTEAPHAVPRGPRVLDLASATEASAAGDAGGLPVVGHRDLAYAIFTSGTTGRPKGALIEHGGLANYATGALRERARCVDAPSPARPLRVVTGTSAYVSDFFLGQVLLLLEGHTLCVLGPEERRDPARLVAWAHDAERAADVLDITTAQAQVLVDHGLLDAPHPPRLLAVGGEACPPDLWRRLAARPGLRAFNTYGPAEATIEATVAPVDARTGPTIGTPCRGVRVHLLDDVGDEVPPGSVGEVHIGGPGVGRGYLGRPGATAERFVPDPWGAPGARLYRTGDLARRTERGDLEFLGRADHQIKVLGQRVEPEEVEAVLRSHPAVTGALVGRAPDGERLVANVVTAGGRPVGSRELREHAAARLPSAAVPARFVPVDALPLAPSGKLDRRALRTGEGAGAPAVESAPDTSAWSETERRVAAVWGALGLRPEPDDDFFAVGGHSLLAVRLAAELGAAFGTPVPLGQLYRTPTVAGQAAFLESARGALLATARGERSVVAMGGRAGARPLVLVHPLGGTLFCYLDLVAGVRDSFDVLGVQGDLTGGTRSADFTATARRYARELAPRLRGRRPVVAGWSAGGVLAHEVAVRLAELGVLAERVVVVDASPHHGGETRADAERLERLRPKVARQGPRRLLAEDGAGRLLELLGVDPEALAELDGGLVASLMGFWQDMLSGLAGHRPSSFAGPVRLVVSRDGAPRARRAAIDGWRRLARSLRVSPADGDHYQLMRDPWVTAVTDALTDPTETEGA